MIAARVSLLIAFAAVALAFGDESLPPPVALPPLNVAAGVPLKKIGEFKMLESRFAAAAVTHGGYIYIIGGQGADGKLSRSIERFDIATGTSALFGTLGVGRMWHRAVIVGDTAYIFGGVVPSEAREADESQRSCSPSDRSVAKRYPPARLSATVEILNLRTGVVVSGPKMPEARAEFGCACVAGKIYIMGGKHFYPGHSVSITNEVEVLDVLTKKWSDGIPMPRPAVGDAVVVTGPFVVTVGGYDGSRKSGSVYAFNPARGTWTGLPPSVRTISAQGTAFIDKYLVCFGDYDYPDEILVYDLRRKASEVFTLQYHAARHSAVVVAGEKIFVIGGKPHRSDEPLSAIQVFALTKSAVQPTPTGE